MELTNLSKQQVQLQIKSNIDGHIITQKVQGELYLKGDTVYYRYEEPEASVSMGPTVTTVKVVVPDRQIKVFRHGGLQSEQTFRLDGNGIGFYQTPQGDLELETRTYDIGIELVQGLGQVSWVYDLWVNSELAGNYKLQLNIFE
ncbi:MAG TPA: DUF1934 domain-containing protein [Bacilli bacterium]